MIELSGSKLELKKIEMKIFLIKLLKLDKDLTFLEKFKEDWNRFCNAYKARRRTITHEEFEQEKLDEKQLPVQVDLGKRFGRFYEIYLKYKFIPDNRFFITLDEQFTTTIKMMHDILGINPYPQEKDNDPDLAYNIRWRGIILIEYLKELTKEPLRYFGILIFRFTLFISIPVGLIVGIVNGINSIFK